MPASRIYDPFVISALPRLPISISEDSNNKSNTVNSNPINDSNKVCIIPTISTSNQDLQAFDIGISGSYIGTFITHPTPKLIWSYSLSPLTLINCLDSYILKKSDDDQINDDGEGDELKLFAVGLTERKKHFIKFISYGGENSSNNNENGNSKKNGSSINGGETDSVITNDQGTHHNPLLNEVQAFTLAVKEKVIDIKFINKGYKIIVVYQDGSLEIHNFKFNEDIQEKPSTFLKNAVKNKHPIVFHRFINPFELNIKERQINQILLTVAKENNSSNKYIVKLLGIETNQVLEISTMDLTIEQQQPQQQQQSIDYSQFCYDSSGKLIYFDTNNFQLSVFQLPTLKPLGQISIGSLFVNEKESNSLISILPSSSNRVLISKGSTLCLIDILNKAVLDTIDLYPKSKLPINESQVKKYKEVSLLQSPIVKGTSIKTKDSFVIYMLKNPNDNFALLNYVSLDVGVNKLSDLLGKGIPKLKEEQTIQPVFKGIPVLISKKNQFKSVLSESVILNNQAIVKSEEMNVLYNELVELKKSNNLKLFESKLINYLKNISEDEQQQQDDEDIESSFKVFEVDKDNVVDCKFIKSIIELIFDYNGSDKTLPTLPDSQEIPERSLTYLLTHPLFPFEYCQGLLDAFVHHPRLMRQAIVTCPNLPCYDLIKELSKTDNEEIFKDLITRLIEEFSTEKITSETVRLIKSESMDDEISVGGKFQVDKIIKKILKLNHGYEILNSIIDSNGLVLSLHYSKTQNNQNQLMKLIEKTQLRLEGLSSNKQLLTVVNQSLNQYELQTRQGDSVSEEFGNGTTILPVVDSIKETKSKVDDLLQLSSSFSVSSLSNKGSATNTKKVPAYSIEKLVI